MPNPLGGVILGGAAIAGGLGLVGANQQAKAARAAAAKQEEAAAAALAEQQRQYNALIERMKPYTAYGEKALGEVEKNLPQWTDRYTYEDYLQSPEYQNQLLAAKEMRDAYGAQAAASGMFGSGNYMKTLQDAAMENANKYYTQGLQNYWMQNVQQMTPWYNVMTMGQNAAAGVGAQGMNAAANTAHILQGSANQIGNALGQGAAAQAAGYQNLGNQIMGAAGAYTNYSQNQQLAQMYQNALAGGGGAGGVSGGVSGGGLYDGLAQPYTPPPVTPYT